jgi:hypothetical protein
LSARLHWGSEKFSQDRARARPSAARWPERSQTLAIRSSTHEAGIRPSWLNDTPWMARCRFEPDSSGRVDKVTLRTLLYPTEHPEEWYSCDIGVGWLAFSMWLVDFRSFPAPSVAKRKNSARITVENQLLARMQTITRIPIGVVPGPSCLSLRPNPGNDQRRCRRSEAPGPGSGSRDRSLVRVQGHRAALDHLPVW